MRQPELRTARAVSEYLLEVTGRAMLDRDFDTVSAVFALPNRITTAGQTKVVTTVCELSRIMKGVCGYYEAQGVTALDRRCVAADFRGPDRVEATHVSRLLAGEREVAPPFPVYSVLERQDGMWRIASSDYAIDDDGPHGTALLCRNENESDALAIYQEHLDALSDALLSGDLDAFAARIGLPHSITTQSEHFMIETPEKMAETFRSFSLHYGSRGLTALVRIAKTARFTGPGEIIGTHESHQLIGSTRITPPFPNRVRLLRGADGLWRETHCANAILNTSDHFHSWTRVADTPRLPDLPDLDPPD